MNYRKIYNQLCVRGQQDRNLEFTEKHHIIPRCMNGSDAPANLTGLTPEEHYLAHLLLVKIYPEESKLIYAANMMCVSGDSHRRSNKRYGWLKRKHILACKNRVGDDNPSSNTKWVTNLRTGETFKTNKTDKLPGDCISGRNVKLLVQCCLKCFSLFTTRTNRKTCSRKCSVKLRDNENFKYSKNKRIEINNVIYTSMSDAARELGVSEGTIRWRLNKTKDPNYRIID